MKRDVGAVRTQTIVRALFIRVTLTGRDGHRTPTTSPCHPKLFPSRILNQVPVVLDHHLSSIHCYSDPGRHGGSPVLSTKALW
jgi:hypothetical protein